MNAKSRVVPTNNVAKVLNLGYEGFEVKFRFMPVKPLNIENVKWVNNTKEDILNRESFLLLNSY